MVKTRKGFKKDSDLMEVVLNPDDNYQLSIRKACNVLRMPTTDKTLALLRISGSIIPHTAPGTDQAWTIGQYIEHAFSSTRSPKNFGIAVIERLSLIKKMSIWISFKIFGLCVGYCC